MAASSTASAPSRITPAGLFFLATTSIGWGFNWPMTKYLLSELPPLILRGGAGVAGALLLAAATVALRQSLRVPAAMWPRLCLYAFLNVTCWMALMGIALLWLPAGETSMVAYMMPIWASLLAWPILGERPTVQRVLALVVGFGGVMLLLGGGVQITSAKLGGFALAITASMAFALGAVLSKRWPLTLPPMASATWQIGLGCLPVSLVGLAIETVDLGAVTTVGWWGLAYSTVIQFCVAYVAWFAALARLPASVATIGTMAVPVFGVVASAVALREPIGPVQIVALLLTLSGVLLATRS